jgi:uncharacterized membrane protein YcaP (DUF421 family)
MFFHSWSAIGHVVVATLLVYLFMIAALRVAGEQALAKMSGYDMNVTITIGSIIATVAVSRDISIAEGVAALVTLLVLQEVVRRGQSRFLAVHHIVREPPRLFVWDGQLLEDRLLASQLSGDEVRAAIRREGFSAVAQVQAVILENDGDWSVIRRDADVTDFTALHGIDIPGQQVSARGEGPTPSRIADPRRVP